MGLGVVAEGRDSREGDGGGGERGRLLDRGKKDILSGAEDTFEDE